MGDCRGAEVDRGREELPRGGVRRTAIRMREEPPAEGIREDPPSFGLLAAPEQLLPRVVGMAQEAEDAARHENVGPEPRRPARATPSEAIASSNDRASFPQPPDGPAPSNPSPRQGGSSLQTASDEVMMGWSKRDSGKQFACFIR